MVRSRRRCLAVAAATAALAIVALALIAAPAAMAQTTPVITSPDSDTLPYSAHSFTFQVTATGDPTPMLSVSNAPAWVNFNPTTGILSGSWPTDTRGSFSFTIVAENGPFSVATQYFTLNVNEAFAIPLSPGTLYANVRVPFAYQLKGTGGFPPYVFSPFSPLPAGLTMSPSGVISGTPAAAQTVIFSYVMSDSGSLTADLPGQTTIAVAPDQFSIRTLALPGATIGSGYSQTLTATLGASPLTWTIAAGALPSGLILNPTTGKITGTPQQVGADTFTVKATDSSTPTPKITERRLTIKVTARIKAAAYVVQGGYSGLLSFALGANGTAPPLTALSGSGTGLNGTGAVTIDPTGRLYVANLGDDAITEYPYGSTSNAAPVATISGSSTGLTYPSALAVSSNGRLYVANTIADTITAYAPGASGNASPVVTIGGADTLLSAPSALTFDSAGDLWVADAGTNSLTEYAPSANNDAAPIAGIFGPLTGLDFPQAMTLDAAGNLLVANTYGNSLTEYPPSDGGDAAPVRTISGSNSGLNHPDGVDVDTVGNIYVANQGANTLTTYAANESDNAAPVTTVNGVGLSSPGKVAVAPPVSVATRGLGKARVGHRYRWQLRAYLGTTPYHWTKIRGRLPKAMRLSRGGRLQGKANHRGVYRFTVRVTDSTRPRMSATARLALRVGKR